MPRSSELADISLLTQEEFTAFYFSLHGKEVQYYLEGLFPRYKEDVRDFTQDAFLRLHDHWAELKSLDSEEILRWLYRVSRNLALDHFRRHEQSRRSKNSADILFSDKILSQDGQRSTKNPSKNPWPELDDQLTHAMALPTILRRLSPGQRKCILLRLRGLSLKEIGDETDITVPAVSKRLTTALERVQECMYELTRLPNHRQ